MAFIDGIIAPLAGLIDKLIPDPKARDAAKLELLKLEGSQEFERIRAQLSAHGRRARGPASSTSCTRCCSGPSPWGS